MALSARDREFYEQKLTVKSFALLFGTTILVGAIIWPALIYLQDWSSGSTEKWSANVVFDLSVMGMLLGAVVSVVMYLIFKFFLSMEWLPKRR